MHYYFHVPFCRSKCGYCAFYSKAPCNASEADAYLKVLEERLTPNGRAETVYIGGGTPTVLTAEQLERLFYLIHSRLEIADGAEISCECNPETLTPEKAECLKRYITRLSLGIQSFEEDIRRNIGRKCSQEALENAVSLAQKMQFKHWNIDLIFALPGQKDEDFFSGVDRCIKSGADHISCYALTAEEQAVLQLPEEDDRAAVIMENLVPFLEDRRIMRYEISNFARPGSECRHNCAVWQGGALTAHGPSASGFDGTDRYCNAETLEDYMRSPEHIVDHISAAERLNEIFAVNLRTVQGWTPEMWSRVKGADSWEKRQELFRNIARDLPADWFDITDEHTALTGTGLMFWNSVAGEILGYGA